MLRRLHPEQPAHFAFTPGNLEWAKAQMAKFPKGRQASAVIPLLWRAQEQEGWLSKPAIEYVAGLLDLAYIRVLEVATFYFMFQLAPVGSVAHVQVCGTTSCMLCGAEDLMAVCRDKIAANPHDLSADGKFSWEEVECLGACANAPMAQIGKDYYEDLTPESLGGIIDALARGEVPRPGPQNGRYASEPAGGLTSLTGTERAHAENGAVALALVLGDTVARITGDEPLPEPAHVTPKAPDPNGATDPDTGPGAATEEKAADEAPRRPLGLDAPREGEPQHNLQLIKGVGPELERHLNDLGIYHFDQIADWGPGEVAWIEAENDAFKGRVIRDGWVEQARELVEEGTSPHVEKHAERD